MCFEKDQDVWLTDVDENGSVIQAKFVKYINEKSARVVYNHMEVPVPIESINLTEIEALKASIIKIRFIKEDYEDNALKFGEIISSLERKLYTLTPSRHP